MNANDFAHGPAVIRLGDIEVNRLGYGAMRLPGKDVWGEPADPENARQLLRKVVDLGINLIDTAWFYGPLVSNRLIKEALHPYPADLVIACKLGGKRLPDKSWAPFIRPEELRKGCEEDLRSLKLDRIDVAHLRVHDNIDVPFLESLDAMIELQKEGKIRHIALSNVDADKISQALKRTPIVSVQNMYNMSADGGFLAKASHSNFASSNDALELCEKEGIAFMPFFPFGAGTLLKEDSSLAKTAKEKGVTAAQLGLAWLLARSPVMLPIPGTSSIPHLEENWEAPKVHISRAEMEEIAKE